MKKIIILSTLLLFITACGKQPVPVDQAPVQDRQTAEILSPHEQQKMAMKVFEEILDITQKSSKKEAFSEIEGKYSTIINTYPQSRIAKESYIRLIHLYITYKSPENISKAKKLLQRFSIIYKNDPMEQKIRNKLAKQK